MPMDEFARRLLAWYRRSGRHDLPWKRDPEPYRVWVSEIMLQQTQVATVQPYFERFMKRYPDVQSLARAPLDEVLHLWSGLGYYARARNLHRSACRIVEQHAGRVPEDAGTLMSLPGIGRSTAAAILALSRNRPLAILDGNVKRVLARFHGIRGWPGAKTVERRLWRVAQSHVPLRAAAAYTQAIMDLGATVCTRAHPDCTRCPLRLNCTANLKGLQDRVPATRPVRSLPTRRAVLALIESGTGKILLERRPPAGIWGGLWSLPECPEGLEVEAWINTRYGWVVRRIERRPAMRHSFTHFRMDISPVHVAVDVPTGVRESADQVWWSPGGGHAFGMASPILKLISENQRERENRHI
jgi:A/G-specific adenine glycosylase